MRQWILFGLAIIILVATFGCYAPNPETKIFYLQISPQDGSRLFKPPEFLGWRGTNDANYYFVEVALDKNFTKVVFVDTVDALEVEPQLLAGEKWYRSQITSELLKMNNTYYWKVQAMFNNGSSRYTTPTSFILGYPIENN